MEKISNIKKLVFILVFLLISFALPLISVELFLRLNPKFGYIYNSFNLLDRKSAPQTRFFAENSYRSSAILGYEHNPNTDGMDGHVNSYGMLGKEYKLEKDKGIYRILILGDSIAAHGWACDFLEDWLNNNPLLRRRYRFEIWNAGVGSYDIRRYALYLKHKGLKYNPDMIIVFFCMNDFEPDVNVYYKTQGGAMAYSFPVSEISKKYVVSPFLLKHSYLYRYIILRVNNHLLSMKKAQGIDSMEENGRYFLQEIKDMCGQQKISLLAVIFPYLKPLSEYQKWQLEQYNTICKVTQELGVPYINLYKYWPTKDLKTFTYMQGDDLHPNRDGHHIAAQEIYNYMLDNFFKETRIK